MGARAGALCSSTAHLLGDKGAAKPASTLLVNPDMVHSPQEPLVSVYQGSSKSGTLQRLLRAARPKADVARAP